MVSRCILVYSDGKFTSFDAFLDEYVIAFDGALCSGQFFTILHLDGIDRTPSSVRFYYDRIADGRKLQLLYEMLASHIE
jgi:hypothetical protein